MVAISFSVFGFEFESGIGAIEQMYLTAHQKLSEQQRRCNEDLQAIERGELVGSGNLEDGLYSAEKLVEHELAGIELSMQLLRQSTLLMAYHFWEKQVLRWARGSLSKSKQQSAHDSYISYCSNRGFLVDVDGLELLRLIANVVKHGQGERAWADRLSQMRPDLFVDDVSRSDYPYELLLLSHELVFDLMNALSASGPKAFSDFVPDGVDMIS